ncbi:hypothetical protein [Pontibacter flavimaris]|uniref:DUF4129 domain-containing protein n=1 Tax=Pontibacter flavimaris TaxID=1797110 RepID=A0A1Q5PHE6_9BACT|nr:hypothetical protein [Pontibacter flavimaris]OKL41645.1 hypothetical protein A3841_11475 [Pontibacter flavimaris]
MRKLIILLLLPLWQLAAQAQQPLTPEGRFNRDTIRLGELVQYMLVLRHPDTLEVILPAANHDFAPFELVSNTYYPTTTRAGISTDSAIYTLRTFETDTLQQLALPIYVLRGQDTLELFSPASTVFLLQLVQTVQEPLQVKADTELAPVMEHFNWPVMLLWVTTVIALVALIWLIFGQSIKRRYKLYRLRKDHLYYTSRFNSHKDRFQKSGVQSSLEKAVALWKNYLTKLERSGINSFTTKEIVEFYGNDEEINTALRICDKAIYGHLQTESEGETNLALGMLRRFSKERYKLHRELIRNARSK